MYSISLKDKCDNNNIGYCNVYVDDLEIFERRWLPMAGYMNNEVEEYYQSKFNMNDKKLNNGTITPFEVRPIEDEVFTYKDKEITFKGRKTTRVKFDELKVYLKIIKIGRSYQLLGQYEGDGCRKINEDGTSSPMYFLGNDIAVYIHREIDWRFTEKSKKYSKYICKDKFYREDTISTFAWIPIKRVDAKTEIEPLTDEELVDLMHDIVGENLTIF
jgi:hypothetical protein